MKVLEARNVHDALPRAISLLLANGVVRESRDGQVIQAPWPVTTVYSKPEERVMFHPERDCNPFFHLYESIWMLAGRNDVQPLLRYAKQMGAYSDDGNTFHGAYGHRWRHWPLPFMDQGMDQLGKIVDTLEHNKDDRRCVLSMWDPKRDLGNAGKDFPCNLTVTFQVSVHGKLDMVVFCRSNDIIWGAYGANAVHFSMLQEFVARMIGLEVGTYSQVSVNWHAYVAALGKVERLKDYRGVNALLNRSPYETGCVKVRHLPLSNTLQSVLRVMNIADFGSWGTTPANRWERVAINVLHAHDVYVNNGAPERYEVAINILNQDLDDINVDWNVAAREWIKRRQLAWQAKMERKA